jgi:hypothetical protein
MLHGAYDRFPSLCGLYVNGSGLVISRSIFNRFTNYFLINQNPFFNPHPICDRSPHAFGRVWRTTLPSTGAWISRQSETFLEVCTQVHRYPTAVRERLEHVIGHSAEDVRTLIV